MDEHHQYFHYLSIIPTKSLMDKVKELNRLLNNKIPTGGLGKNGEKCRKFIIIEIACKISNIPIIKEKVLKLSGSTLTEYQKHFTACKVALNLKLDANVLCILSIQYNEDLILKTKRVLQLYDENYIKKLSENTQSYINLDLPIYQCAAFYIAAQLKKDKIDKTHLLNLAEVTISKFMDIVEKIQNILKTYNCYNIESISTIKHSFGSNISLNNNITTKLIENIVISDTHSSSKNFTYNKFNSKAINYTNQVQHISTSTTNNKSNNFMNMNNYNENKENSLKLNNNLFDLNTTNSYQTNNEISKSNSNIIVSLNDIVNTNNSVIFINNNDDKKSLHSRKAYEELRDRLLAKKRLKTEN